MFVIILFALIENNFQMASASVGRRSRSMSYSQGDSSKYTLRSRTHSIDETARENTILEEDEVDVALLLSQLRRHHIDLEDQHGQEMSGMGRGDVGFPECMID